MGLEIGTLIDDRYRVVGVIGHGGMADVYEADDLITHKQVAVKLIKDKLMNSSLLIRRFRNEAAIAASLNHKNIVQIINNGTIDGRPYIIEEYIKGQDLKNVLDIRQNIPLREAIDIMIQLTDAIAYSHSKGIIHCDIKPSNIFLLADGSIKLCDFGIAVAEKYNINSKETKDAVEGSIYYISPEMCDGKNMISPQSDIYSLGITFFELITGKVPFTGNNVLDVAVKHCRAKMPSATKYLNSCPKEIDRIIFKATEKKPKDRYSSALVFKNDLVELTKRPELLKEKKGLLAKIFGFK